MLGFFIKKGVNLYTNAGKKYFYKKGSLPLI